MRNRFIEDLEKQAEKNTSITLVVGDLGYGVIEAFSNRFPDRFFNSGVAEQNMMGFSAGLASEGQHVFAYSIANFPIFRCAEQIRNDVCYHELNVTVVAVGGGLAYGNLGYSHHAVQDYAFMRSLPNMIIMSPGDPNEVSHCINYICDNPGPSYLRLGKSGEKNYTNSDARTSPGHLNFIVEENNARKAVVVTGSALQDVMSYFPDSGVRDFDILSCPIWGMGLTAQLSETLSKYDRVVTVEDHLLEAGFGSWVLEGLEPSLRNRLRTVGLNNNVCGMVGSQSLLNQRGGLSKDSIDSALVD